MTAGQNRIPVNLDYAASTPMRAEARLAQREYDDSELAGVNPNSLHSLGRKAAARLEAARREIARSFGARVRPSEIILTNGGTEANQLALLGLAEGARQRDRKRDRVIVSAIEHDSILDNLPLLRAAGFTVDLVQPCRAGYIETAALNDLLGDDVALVSIMAANNETGVVSAHPRAGRGRAYRGRPVPHRCHPGLLAYSARCHRAGRRCHDRCRAQDWRPCGIRRALP